MTTDNRITLPTDISPNNYRLSLSPDMEKFTFGGESLPQNIPHSLPVLSYIYLVPQRIYKIVSMDFKHYHQLRYLKLLVSQVAKPLLEQEQYPLCCQFLSRKSPWLLRF